MNLSTKKITLIAVAVLLVILVLFPWARLKRDEPKLTVNPEGTLVELQDSLELKINRIDSVLVQPDTLTPQYEAIKHSLDRMPDSTLLRYVAKRYGTDSNRP